MVVGVRPTGHHDILAEAEPLGGHRAATPFAVAVAAAVGAHVDVVLRLAVEVLDGVGVAADGSLLGGCQAGGVKRRGAAHQLVGADRRVVVVDGDVDTYALGAEGEAGRRGTVFRLQGDGPVSVHIAVLCEDTHTVGTHLQTAAQGVPAAYADVPVLGLGVVHIGNGAGAVADATAGAAEVGGVVYGHRHGVVDGVYCGVAAAYAVSGDVEGRDGALVALSGERRHADGGAVLVGGAVGHDNDGVIIGVGGETHDGEGLHTGLGGAEQVSRIHTAVVYTVGGVLAVAVVSPADSGTVAGDIAGGHGGDLLAGGDGLHGHIVDVPVGGIIIVVHMAEGNAGSGRSALQHHLALRISSAHRAGKALHSHKCGGILDVGHIAQLQHAAVGRAARAVPETHLQGVGSGSHLGQYCHIVLVGAVGV